MNPAAAPRPSDGQGWRFLIDRGGTFTDVVAVSPQGQLTIHKVLSREDQDGTDPAVAAIAQCLGLPPSSGATLPTAQLAAVRMGTTVGTNALLERRGSPTALAATAGLGDVLRIDNQARPALFDLAIPSRPQLAAATIEIHERLDAQGQVIIPLDESQALAALRQVLAQGIRSLAICLAHSYRNPAHELRLAQLAEAMGFEHVSCSALVSPLIKLAPRAQTTVVDAYLSNILKLYIRKIQQVLQGVPLLMMQSNGVLVPAARFRGRDCLLSGPAGGIVGAVETARACGFERIVGFDMGGTSTDCTYYAGCYQRPLEQEIAGLRLRVPTLAIHTVAAGGGSVCTFDGARFRVGPQSAGADPGPACYGRNGPLTITDCQLVLGVLDPATMPRVFGPDGQAPADSKAAASRAEEVGRAAGMPIEAVARGFITVAVEHMARAIKRISIEQGHALHDHVLQCFGGAGPQHACDVADALGMHDVLIHPCASVLSAYGMGLAPRGALQERSIEQPLQDFSGDDFQQLLEPMRQHCLAELQDQGGGQGMMQWFYQIHLKVAGSDWSMPVDLDEPGIMSQRFIAGHRERFGFAPLSDILLVETITVEASIPEKPLPPGTLPAKAAGDPSRARRVYLREGWQELPVWRRAALGLGQTIAGPAVCVEETTTTLITPGWQGTVLPDGTLHLQRTRKPKTMRLGDALDPVMLEVMGHRFMAIAEAMGGTLQRTAASVNIKERLDFSCALFDQTGQLVANAPHMPVHLGSMGESVRAVIARWAGTWQQGDAYVLNNPYLGGTHLPDITVVSPLVRQGRTVAFFASRGHHADVGGSSPGSMPPFSTTIQEEGALLDPMPLLLNGQLQSPPIAALLEAAGARNIPLNMADLQAQIGANRHGAALLQALMDELGESGVLAYMTHLQDHAARAVAALMPRLQTGHWAGSLDHGATVTVTLRREQGRLVIDFNGTSPRQPDNSNAPGAVARAAVLYVLRTLLADDIPLNEGCLRDVQLVLPHGSMLQPEYPDAVVAGNVETSQLIVNTLYGALGTMAACGHTMSNVTFGNARHQYYETVSGGSGAGPTWDGAPCVQTHMTNSRLTDPEILELRFPVRVLRHAVRPASGGAGMHHGGDGAIRELLFLEAMEAAILSNSRTSGPWGLAGGQPGAPGRNAVRRANGAIEELGSSAQVHMEPGDALIVETPGGGGYGAVPVA